MGVKQKLRSMFGWTSSVPPRNKPVKGEPEDFSLAMTNPYSAYANSIKPPIERRRRYDIYDDLDELPEITSILDAYAEDATQFDREKKSTVWIECKDSKVLKVLQELFERLKLEEYIEAIIRDTGKYGDDFAVLDIDEDQGIVGWDWSDPRDVERIENNQGTLVGFERSEKLKSVIQILAQDTNIEYTYKPWDIVHFRLFRRKRVAAQKFRNIYGTALLAGAERIGKQVKILDDMLMVRRLTKTLDKYSYKVDVGRSAVEEEIQILKKWKNAIKRKAYIDPTNDRFDSTFDPFTWSEDIIWPQREGSTSSVEVIPGQPNVADIVDIQHFQNKLFGTLRAPKAYFGFEGDINCLGGDTKVSLLTGIDVPISELVGKSDVWVYSLTKEGKIIPALAYDIRKSGEVSRLYEVILDSGECLLATAEHRFVRRSGELVAAKDLRSGDSLLPLYRSTDDKGYETIEEVTTGKTIKTHQLVIKAFFGDRIYKDRISKYDLNVVHHIDFNKRNNDPANLIPMSYSDHFELHAEHGFPWSDPAFREKVSARQSIVMTANNKDSSFTKKRVDALREKMRSGSYDSHLSRFNIYGKTFEQSSKAAKTRWATPSYRTKVLPKLLARQAQGRRERQIKLDSEIYYGLIATEGNVSLMAESLGSTERRMICRLRNRGLHYRRNHVDGCVYCSEVITPLTVSKPLTEFKFVKRVLSNNHKVISIKLLEYKDPVPVYDLSVDSETSLFATGSGVFIHNSKASLSSQDMKWGRAVNALQRAAKNGIKRLCQIELALHNMDPFAEFSIGMVTPSVLDDLSRLEATQTLADVASRLSELGETLQLNKKEWKLHILQSVLGMNDEEVDRFLPSPDDTASPPEVDSPSSAYEPSPDEVPTGTLSTVPAGGGSPEISPGVDKDKKVQDLSESDVDRLLRNLIFKKLNRSGGDREFVESVRREELPATGFKFSTSKHIVPIGIPLEDDED